MGITPALAGKSESSRATTMICRDHPRVGGEKRLQCCKIDVRLGSPPRWRGKAWTNVEDGMPTGITPALAGKSRTEDLGDRVRRDHPRVGGEKCAAVVLSVDRRGSPPRWRGKAIRLHCGAFRAGITPALAGKRHSGRRCQSLQWDHPRVGGEKVFSSSMIWAMRGSPPRWRGKEGPKYHNRL